MNYLNRLLITFGLIVGGHASAIAQNNFDLPITLSLNPAAIESYVNDEGKSVLRYVGWALSSPTSIFETSVVSGDAFVVLPAEGNRLYVPLTIGASYMEANLAASALNNCQQFATPGTSGVGFEQMIEIPSINLNPTAVRFYVCTENPAGGGTTRYLVSLSTDHGHPYYFSSSDPSRRFNLVP